MANNKLYVPFSATNAGIDYAILVAKKAVYPYADGRRTSDIPTGYSVSLALHGNAFAQLSVKVEGPDPLPQIDEEEIANASAALKPILVRPKDCTVSLYTIDGQLKMSATAASIEVVNSATSK